MASLHAFKTIPPWTDDKEISHADVLSRAQNPILIQLSTGSIDALRGIKHGGGTADWAHISSEKDWIRKLSGLLLTTRDLREREFLPIDQRD